MSDETYNGWTNRETWAVNLWTDNEPYLTEHRDEMVRQFSEDSTESQIETATAEWFENILEGLKEDMPSFYQTLLEEIGSLYRVNWLELGQMWLDEVEL